MRWVIRGLVALVLLAALAVGALFLVPGERIAALAADQVRKATGRTLVLAGGVSPSLWPEIGVETGAVTLANADWSEAGPMLQADGLAIGLDLRALLGGEIAIREITVLHPQILLERAADGRANWAFAGTAGPADGTTGDAGQGVRGPPGFTLDRGQIDGGRLTYLDHGTGARVELTALDAVATLPDRAGPADIRLSARLNGQEVSAAAHVAHAADLAAGGETEITADAALGRASLAFDGRAGLAPLAGEGKLYADLSDLPAIFAALGRPAPDLPAGVGQWLAVEGQVALLPDGAVHLRNATLRQDSNVIAGGAELDPGARPHLSAQLTAGALDLSAFTGTGGAGGGAGGGATDGGGWSTDPIDLSALGALDAEVALSASAIDLGKIRLGPTRATARLEDRRLALDLQELQAWEGLVTGSLVLNGRGGVSVRGDLTFANMAAQAMLEDLAGFDRLVAAGNGRVDFLASGPSVAALMASLSGGGAVSFGKGELRGLDLAGMLRTLDASYMGEGAKTIFDAITASFTIDKGVLRNDDLSLRAPLVTASGRGTVGIGARTVDYTLVPAALPGADGSGGLRVPLRITGPWSGPKFQLDVEGLAEERLKKEREALEAKARDRAAEELGVAPDTGESLEDAARRRLEEEAAKGLRKLLGGN